MPERQDFHNRRSTTCGTSAAIFCLKGRTVQSHRVWRTRRDAQIGRLYIGNRDGISVENLKKTGNEQAKTTEIHVIFANYNRLINKLSIQR
ncbi:MAG: hypothetical protein LBS43_08710 [Prevotellaceae bacterium]|nr:hypothetical protein [Prevotellaceae bacterium]